MASNAKCRTPPAAVLLIVMLWLSARAADVSDSRALCPPIVDYTTTDQARAAVEVEALPESAVIVRMLGDYAVMRDQARACQQWQYQLTPNLTPRLRFIGSLCHDPIRISTRPVSADHLSGLVVVHGEHTIHVPVFIRIQLKLKHVAVLAAIEAL